MTIKNLLDRLNDDLVVKLNDLEITAPIHAKEIKDGLKKNYFINDIPLNIAYQLCVFVIGTSLDINKICESFKPIEATNRFNT